MSDEFDRPTPAASAKAWADIFELLGWWRTILFVALGALMLFAVSLAPDTLARGAVLLVGAPLVLWTGKRLRRANEVSKASSS